ncbi:hypothetical protein M9H77_17089 [Catharanthus roseus]|uniref:Uncharacterized protein n=1 Tax=Catharanthus roseus TaxID=4058 RepID=A0ACC0B3M7_CATRO|nr:hypothetical protein M9H77_17089 [Catharanthus roseus]
MAALQQTLITFRSRSPPSTQIPNNPSAHNQAPFCQHQKRNRGASGASMADTAAGSYASILANVAKSNGTLEQTAADLEKIKQIFKDEEVLRFFANPTIVDSKKYSVIGEIAKSSNAQPHVVNFLNILVDMNRA